jgi:CRISPR-associated endonuclease/helicase Cas3
MDKKRLWAKSCPMHGEPRDSMYLHGHLRDVYEAASRVLDATADAQLHALGLGTEFRDRLVRCVKLAAAVHDLGKANDHFQGMILGDRKTDANPQGLRHEWVTVLLMQQMREWLLPAVNMNATDLAFVEWAVAGHHPAHNHASPPRSGPPGGGTELTAHTQHKDFGEALNWLRTTFGLAENLPPFAKSKWPLVGSGNAFNELAKWERDARRVWDGIRNRDEAKLLAAIKNCLIAADVAGSALPKHGPPDWEQVTKAFAAVPSADDLKFLSNYGLEGKQPRAFQAEVADHPGEVVYVKAGCGTGKTVAAYMRAASKWAGRRLYFCYPTTGTATEGFKDYLYPEWPAKPEDDTPEKKAERERLLKVNADLFHSRSAVDYEIILDTGRDTPSAEAESAARAEALDSWATPVVACTVDTVLGIVQNNRRGLFGWPALAQSAFVFDEIHAYDDRLFGALLRFLRDLPGLPALLMTASLPVAREEVLKRVLKKYRNIDLEPIKGPEDLEILPRYHKADWKEEELLEKIVEEVKRGGKVLWVSNTVNRVMEASDRAATKGLKPLIYHSRFKYEDRVQRHKAVIDAFAKDDKIGVLACTSQVCEMSLDLKGCTLLVTELTPVPALIQRLGRLNRHATDGAPTRPFFVTAPENHLPYTPAELTSATAWLAKLPPEGISQQVLAREWEQSSENPPELVPSAWLDGGPMCSVVELREASPGITVVVGTDLERVARSSDLGKYTLPMPPPPKKLDWKSWRKYKGIPVAPETAINYDAKRGATWQSK